ncbi:MAG TPA: acetylxylan esterase, partial [Planctomycetaceae bacterium]|nr:acetylxylan esterase [Planctomycetaceae bacterium]
MTIRSLCSTFSLLSLFSVLAVAADPAPVDTTRGDAMIAEYFRHETAKLTADCLADVRTKEDWENKKPEYRRQLFEMLGLDPLPERTPLHETITGTIEHEEFLVEKLHFQSRPGLYVTGNLYRPKNMTGKLPAILYVCGHGRVKKDGISYGNKASYQHHGGWFARNGYVCLIIDTLQLGEIEGIHHGTYNHNMWWWNSRGYTSAGVEAWNCIRALDYLQSREEVDPERIGVTGRSGGGAYSWWIAALDERIKAAVPVAGITSLHNHVVDGTVEGHCDCMFMVNTYRWDFPLVAALVAPRPLLISNSDKDRIFPLEGVIDVYSKTRRIYDLYGARDRLGLQITEGPHKDTQELRIHAFHWMNRFLKDEDPLIDKTAIKFFEPEQLKVFGDLPADELNTKIQESFTVVAAASVPESGADWADSTRRWRTQLQGKSFRGWPQAAPDLNLEPAFSAERDGIRFSAWDFTSQESIRLRLYFAHRANLKPDELELVVLNVLDEQGWRDFLAALRPGFEHQLSDETLPEGSSDRYEEQKILFQNFKWGMAYLAPRGIGPTAWDQSERKQTQHRRRFQLLGQTLDGMRVWDIVRGCAALRQAAPVTSTPLWLQAERNMSCNTLYAALFAPDIKRID